MQCALFVIMTLESNQQSFSLRQEYLLVDSVLRIDNSRQSVIRAIPCSPLTSSCTVCYNTSNKSLYFSLSNHVNYDMIAHVFQKL